MTGRKRTLAVFAAGALFAPFIATGTALAAHTPTPPAQDISQFCANSDDSQFTDVNDPTSKQAIDCIATLAITRGGPEGLPDTQYGPTLNVSRAQMALFISRMMDRASGLETSPTAIKDLPPYSGPDRFTDLGGLNAEARDAINRLASAGLVTGGPYDERNKRQLPPTQYGPTLNVSRAQMASFINRALEYLSGDNSNASGDYFTDDEAATAHEQNINDLAALGIVQGVADGTYNPSGLVSRAQMALFISRNLAELNDRGLINEVPPAVQPTEITVTNQGGNVEAGQPVTGTITGENIDTVNVSGPCVTSGPVTDSDTATDGFQFSIPTKGDAQAGACTLTFTVAYTDSRADETFQVDVNVTRPVSATALPELVSASVGATTTSTNQTPSNPAGTLVTYTFDEPVIGGTNAATTPRAGRFLLYNSDGTLAATGDNIVSVNGRDVVVRFTALNTTASTAALTVATVDADAVTDQQGDVNPEGDAAIGTSGGGNTTLPAGTTVAPDLVSVGNFRQGANQGETAVDFTFDEAARVVAAGGGTPALAPGFHLILVDNPAGMTGPDDNDLQCAAPGNANNDAGGGTVAGGNGTTTITVVCANSGVTATNPNGTPITAASVARGVVDGGTVAEQANNDTTNNAADVQQATQTADVSNSGNTFEPDLVSVTFTQGQPGGAFNGADTAVFTFDQAVTITDPAGFFAYDTAATPVPGTAQQTNGTGGTGPGTQVLVSFASATALDQAVGGFVNEAAVTVPATATTTSLANEEDEVGVANSTANPTQTPGRTQNPDLTGVALSQGTDAFGNPTNFRATYTFDEPVDPAPIAGNFYLYLADGTRLQGTTCTTGTTTTGAGQNNSTVTCTAYNVLSGATPPASSPQIGSATLGTVENGAVNAVDNGTNPEGAEFTTGGTGTRTA